MKKDAVISENIGRSLHKVPGKGALSFVQKVSDKEWVIKRLDTETKQVSNIAPTVSGSEDLGWLPDGKIIMSDGAKLFFLQSGKSQSWSAVQIESGADILKGVTRLAVSSNGKKLAVVVTE